MLSACLSVAYLYWRERVRVVRHCLLKGRLWKGTVCLHVPDGAYAHMRILVCNAGDVVQAYAYMYAV